MTEESRENDMGMDPETARELLKRAGVSRDTSGPMTFNGKPIVKPDGSPFSWHELVEGKGYDIDPVTGVIYEAESGTLFVTPGFHGRMIDFGVEVIAINEAGIIFHGSHPGDFAGGERIGCGPDEWTDWAEPVEVDPKAKPIDQEKVTELGRKFLNITKEHYQTHGATLDSGYEILNAMTFAVGIVLAGAYMAGGPKSESVAATFFVDALRRCLKQFKEDDAFKAMLNGEYAYAVDPTWGDR